MYLIDLIKTKYYKWAIQRYCNRFRKFAKVNYSNEVIINSYRHVRALRQLGFNEDELNIIYLMTQKSDFNYAGIIRQAVCIYQLILEEKATLITNDDISKNSKFIYDHRSDTWLYGDKHSGIGIYFDKGYHGNVVYGDNIEGNGPFISFDECSNFCFERLEKLRACYE